MPGLPAPAALAAPPHGDREPAESLLARLYAEQLALTPGDAYLTDHARPRVVAEQVAAFRWYRPLLPPTGAVLDWGCNHAPDSCLLRASGGDYALHGCDFGPPGRFRAFSDFADLQFRPLTHLYQLPYGDAQYDAVIASGVLEHVAWEYESLKELYRVLRPGGVLIITYPPNRLSTEEWRLRALHKKGHRRSYGLTETRRTLLRTGFEVIDGRFQVLYGGWRGALKRAIPSLGMFSSTLCFAARKLDSM